jgi:hypothetical protein
MRISLEDKEGLPWTASTGLGWIVLIVALTSGTALLALALYLALWIRSKGRSALPMYGFTFVLASIPVYFTLEHFSPNATDATATAVSIVWLISTFALRHQIVRHFKESEGWDISIGLFFTFCFSVIYINYRLNPLTFTRENTVTSLNLSTSPEKPIPPKIAT